MNQLPVSSKVRTFVFRIFTCTAFVLLLTLCASNALGQESYPTFEFGVHYPMLFVKEKSDKDSGLGARFTYNVTNYLGLEAEANGFSQTREGGGNNETQGLFGVRAGIRKPRYGLYAKVRPGFTRFYLLGITPGPNTFEQGHTRFSVDVGGVFEYYPTRHTAIRVDAGDTMINYKSGDFFYQRLDEPMFVRSGLSHNLQLNIGFAIRF